MRRRVVESKREKTARKQHARATPYRNAPTNPPNGRGRHRKWSSRCDPNGLPLAQCTKVNHSNPQLADEFITPTSGSLPTPNATAVGRTSASSYLTVPSGQATIIRLTNAGSGGTLQNISVPTADLHPCRLHLTARAARQEDFP